ncbi:DUF4864 domain-containing protein [Marinobacter sp. VGCF2001]|uniref:DUF4864 domain-containing protein n=1 Tax=Marinobacter sp. VGCF2001 TaxID=3417189 RepID=UPI003CECAA07
MNHSFKNMGRWVMLLVAVGAVAVWSSQTAADDRDRNIDTAIRNTILLQIEAFANNDGEQAWAHASEGVKQRFGSSDVFLSMVRQAYPAVHRARTIEFTERVPHGSFEIQTVKLQGPEGKRWDAYYRMVPSAEDWKIAGVRLHPADTGI